MSAIKTLSAGEYQIGWIAALPIERAAATALLDELHDAPTDFIQHHSDDNAYTWGRVSSHNVVIASLPAGVYGLAAATITAQGLISSLPSIKVGLLVGIGAGIPESGLDIRLGDVAISKPEGTTGGVIQYDFGKAKADGQWERIGVLRPPPAVLLNALAKLQAEHKIRDSQIPTLLEKASKKHHRWAAASSYPGASHDRLFYLSQNDSFNVEKEKQRPERMSLLPQLHYGTIASGNMLVKDAQTRQSIVAATGHPCICLEMEAAGLMNNFPCLVVRGICDYADSHKNDMWHEYASATAAAFTKELLYHVPRFELDRTQNIGVLLGNIQSSLDDMKEGIRQVKQHQQTKQDERASELMQALYTCPYLDHKNRNSTRVAGTCEWFTKHQRFQEWQDGRGPGLLWTSADPGCGKSVLARYLIDEVLPKSGKKVCYFFFKDDFPDQKSSTNAICALLRQLLEFYPESITANMLKKFKDDRSLYTTSFQTLWEAFTDAVLRVPSNGIVCVLDALDECRDTDRQQLIKNICDYAKKPEIAAEVKFLVTSRSYIDIKSGFYDFEKSWSRIHLSGEGDEEVKMISQEIDIVTKHRIREICLRRQLTPDEEQFLITKFTSQPQRTYLWAYLTLDIIATMPELSKRSVYKAITQLPNTVNEAYDRIISRSPDKGKAKILLALIVAAEHPLTLEELSLMLALNGKQVSLSDLNDYMEPHERFKTTIRTICGLFVVVKDTSVYLLHQTAREFLTSTKEDRGSGNGKTKTASDSWKGALQFGISHRIIVERCLWLLMLRKYSEVSINTNTLALFDYCDCFWPYHFRNSDIEANDHLTSLAVPYIDIMVPHRYKIWDHRHYEEPDYMQKHKLGELIKHGNRRLNCLCLLGLTEIVIHTLKSTKFSFVKRKVLSQALFFAALGNHTDTAHLLLMCGALANMNSLRKLTLVKVPSRTQIIEWQNMNKFYKSNRMFGSSNSVAGIYWKLSKSSSPLHLAVQQQNRSLVELLLRKGAQVNVADTKYGYMPLHIAAMSGDHSIIQLLLEHGADKTTPDAFECTPLRSFIQRRPHDGNCGAIIGLLWNNSKGAHDGKDYPKLSSFGNCKSCLTFWLNNSKGIPNRDKQIGYTLTEKIRYGYNDLAELLVENGADVNTQEQDGTTPLIDAASRYNSSGSFIKHLLDHGADPNVQDKEGSSCIHYVRTLGALEVLLAYGADVNLKNCSGTTPLLRLFLDAHLDSQGLIEPELYSDMYNAMIRLGADPDIKNNDGQTARIIRPQTSGSFNGNFSRSSYQIRIDGEMNLTAICTRRFGEIIPSTIDLCSCLCNKNGRFSWTANGGFSTSIKDVRLATKGRVLVAELLDDEGKWNEAYVFLDERIENHDGTLRFVN